MQNEKLNKDLRVIGNSNNEEKNCCGPDCCETSSSVANDDKKIKEMVREKYAEIAREESTCCGTSCCGTSQKIVGYTIMNDEYHNLNGYVAGYGENTKSVQIR